MNTIQSARVIVRVLDRIGEDEADERLFDLECNAMFEDAESIARRHERELLKRFSKTLYKLGWSAASAYRALEDYSAKQGLQARRRKDFLALARTCRVMDEIEEVYGGSVL